MLIALAALGGAAGATVLIALGLSAIAAEQDFTTAVSLLPYLVASGGFLVGGAALALDVRSRHLEGPLAPPADLPSGRSGLDRKSVV